MSFLNMPININSLPDSESMEPIPAGTYQVMIDGAELKTNKAGTGQYINLKLKVRGGQYNNRVFFDIINISNSNETAQTIGLAALKKIMSAIKLETVQNTDQLIGGFLAARVVVESDMQYGDKNKVKDYHEIIGNSPAMASTQPSFGVSASAPQQQPQYQQVQQAAYNPEDDLPF